MINIILKEHRELDHVSLGLVTFSKETSSFSTLNVHELLTPK